MADRPGSHLRSRGGRPLKSTFGLTWRNSSYSNVNGQNCVEVAEVSAGAAVRDSKAPRAGHPPCPPRRRLASLPHRSRMPRRSPSGNLTPLSRPSRPSRAGLLMPRRPPSGT
ncbi:DUF397 domain-containing protein [Amycolatopsis sp. CA-230715]|uniref:DUF397 domain-containing protein n=1 Tax=Amycolatopsis sp. CA-230715 TaxID=2745196 RepID=UPI001C01722D